MEGLGVYSGALVYVGSNFPTREYGERRKMCFFVPNSFFVFTGSNFATREYMG